MAWWREAGAGWLPASHCRPGAGSTSCAEFCTRRDDGVPVPVRFPLCRRRPRLRWQSPLRRRARAPGWCHNWNCSLSEWSKVTCSAFSPSLVVYHINCHPVVENQALRVLPNWRESADQVFCRDKCDSSSVFIFIYTIHRWVKSKHCIRSFGFWLALSSGPPTGPQPTAIQHVVQTVMGIVRIITDTYMVMLKTFEVLLVWMTSI